MARIRTVKPDFWTDPDAADLSIAARLAYIGMWNFCDDHGVMRDDPRRLKLQILPSDDVDMGALIKELVDIGKVRRAKTPDGERVLFVPGFRRHQKVDRRSTPQFCEPDDLDFSAVDTPDSPEPPRAPPNPPEPPRALDEDALTSGFAESRRVPPSPAAVREGKGREGKDQNNRAAPAIDILGPPTTASQGSTLAKTLYRWFVDRGETITPHERRSDDYRRLLALTGQHHDIRDGPYKRIAEGLCREFADELTGEPLPEPAVKHMRRIIAQNGGEAALDALAKAITQGAGTDGEYALDQRALSKYANAILSGQRKAVQ